MPPLVDISNQPILMLPSPRKRVISAPNLMKSGSVLTSNKLQQLIHDIREEQVSDGPVYVGTFDPLSIAHALETLTIRSKVKIWARQDGALFLYGLPSVAHEVVHSVFSEYLYDWVFINGLRKMCKILPSPRCVIGNGIKEPDLAVYDELFQDALSSDSEGNKFPTFVVETAVHHESVPVLEEELDFWLKSFTSVQMAIGIKVFSLRKNKTRRIMAIVASKSERLYYEIGSDIKDPPDLVIPAACLMPSQNIQTPCIISGVDLRADILKRFLQDRLVQQEHLVE